MIDLPKLPWPREPFRGIEQFRFIDRPIFFERREEIRRLIRLVSIYRGTLLYGDSGTGKSSVINAGFIPAILEEGFLPERLRVQPIPGCEIVVERLALTDEGTAPFMPSRFAANDEPRTRLVFSAAQARERLAAGHAGGTALLIFDQFEEFVTLFEEAPENREKLAEAMRAQQALLDLFQELLRSEALPVKLLFVFREDYLAKLNKLFALVPNLRDQYVRLTCPDSGILKKLIRGPFTSEIPAEHFGHIISEEVATKLCAALEERSEKGSINLTEVQIACLSLWRDPKSESLFENTTNRAAVVQKLLEGHLTGALDRLSAPLREPAVAILRHLVTSSGTRNIILEADLLERLQVSDKISPATSKRALEELSRQSRLIRRQRRNEAYFYDITSEFLVPWIRRQKLLSDERMRMRKMRNAGLAVLGLILVLAVAAGWNLHSRNRAIKQEKDHVTAEKAEVSANFAKTVKAYEQKLGAGGALNEPVVSDDQKNKQEIADDLVVNAPGDDPPMSDADISHAQDFVTDKIFNHKGVVWSARYSSPQFVAFTGKVNFFLLTASQDKTAGFWDLKLDNDFFLTGHKGEVNDVQFNPKTPSDGSGWHAATASDDKTAALWKATDPGKPLFLKGHTEAVTGLAWSADGKWLATTSKDNQVRIWNAGGPDPSKGPRTLAGHTGSVWSPCLVETGGQGWLVTPSGDGTARVWTFPKGEPVAFSKSPEVGVLRHGSPVRRATMDSEARWIVTAGAAGHAMLWDRVTGEKLLTVHHEKPVRDVSFKPGGTLFVTAAADNTAEVWDAAKKQGIVILKGHTAPVFSARFTPNGTGVVTVSWDRTARLWNYQTRECVAVLRGHLDVVWSVEFAPNGANFTTTSSDGTARLWDLKQIPGGDAFLPRPAAK
ncbi:MAG TPA: WD40 repeat domain-containing protein [Chthoniobacterales bacterium]|jgi:WD40 repeat protein|nr:WD40 repeat domain-containing protein [Chthoniobacterales bacterium]